MPFFVYILYSASLDQYYVGQSENLEERMYRHKNSGSKSTKKASDWELKYTETFDERRLYYKADRNNIISRIVERMDSVY